MSHTPGPWIADAYSVWSKANENQPGVRLLTTDWQKFTSESGLNARAAVSSLEAIANTHLIAAAPEMLAFLETLASQDIDDPESNSLSSELHRIIAKARGES